MAKPATIVLCTVLGNVSPIGCMQKRDVMMLGHQVVGGATSSRASRSTHLRTSRRAKVESSGGSFPLYVRKIQIPVR